MKRLLLPLLLCLAAVANADQQIVNVGAAANDKTGDPARTAFGKLNANDTELYGVLTVPTGTVLGNASGGTQLAGGMTSIPASVAPIYSGDCHNSIGTPTVFVCDSASGGYNVTGPVSASTSVAAGTTVTAGTTYIHGVTIVCEASGTNSSGVPLYTHTGDTAETSLVNCTIPQGSWVTGASLRITALWYRNATTTNSIAYVIRVGTQGAVSGGDVPLNTTNSTSGIVWTQTESILWSVDSTHQLTSSFGTSLVATNSSAPSVGTLNTANVQYVNFNCKDTTSSSDTCGLYAYIVELITP